MSLLSTVTKILWKFNDINNDTAKKLGKNTSVFDESRNEILRKAEEKKQKLLEEKQAAEERRQAALNASKEEKEIARQEEEQTRLEQLDEENKRQEEQEAEVEIQEAQAEEEEAPQETEEAVVSKEDAKEQVKDIREENRSELRNEIQSNIEDYRESVKEIQEKREAWEEVWRRAEESEMLKHWLVGLQKWVKGLISNLDYLVNAYPMIIESWLDWKSFAEESLDYYKAKEKKQEEELKNSWDYKFNNNEMLMLDTKNKEDGQSDEDLETEAQEVLAHYNEISEPFEKTNTTLMEHSERVELLNKKLDEAKEQWNPKTIEQIEIEIEKETLEYYRDFYEYVLWQRFAWSTLKELFTNIIKETDWRYTIADLASYKVKEYTDKIADIQDSVNKLNALQVKFNIRSNYNVAHLPVDTLIRTLEDYQVLLTDEDKQSLAVIYSDVEDKLEDYDIQIKNATTDQERQAITRRKEDYKIWMSFFTEFMQNSTSEIARKAEWDPIMADTIIDLYTSKEAAELKAFLTNPDNIEKFRWEDWQIDYVALWNYIEKSDAVKNFWALSLSYKWWTREDWWNKKVEWAETWFWKRYYWLRKSLSSLIKYYEWEDYLAWKYEEALLKYMNEWWYVNKWTWETWDDFNDKYIENVLWADYDFGKLTKRSKRAWKLWKSWLENQSQMLLSNWIKRWDVITDKIVRQIKKQDVIYAQDLWKNLWNTLEIIWDNIQAYPAETSLIAGSIALPVLWTSTKIAWTLQKWWELLKLWNNTRAIWNAWSMLVWEIAEWEMINVLLDSTIFWDPAPLWNLLDVWIWAFRAYSYIKAWIDAWKFIGKLKKWTNEILNSIAESHWMHWAADLKLTDLTQDDKDLLNQFYNEKWFGLISDKKYTDFLKDDMKIDWAEAYKNYQASIPPFLWWTAWESNRALLQRIQEEALWREILAMTNADDLWRNKEILEALYRKAARTMDERTLKELLKWNWQLNWQQNVIRQWLQNQMTSLKQIWKTKMWVYLWDFVSKTAEGMTANLNEQFSKKIESLKKLYSQAPEDLKPAIQELIDRAWELWTSKKILPLYLTESWFEWALKLDKINTDKFNSMIGDLLSNKFTESFSDELKKLAWDINKNKIRAVVDWWESAIDSKIIKAYLADDKDKMISLIMWDKQEAEKLWIKVYDRDEYKKAIQWISESVLSDWQKERLQQLLDIIDWIDNRTIKIIELPESIKKSVESIKWFMWYLEDWDTVVITLASSLISDSKKFSDIKVLTHELWHVLFNSLTKKTRSQIALWLISLIDWKEMWKDLLKKIIPNLPKNRKDKLLELHRDWDMVKFVEELCADSLSFAVAAWIQWNLKSWETIWEALISQMAKWKRLTEVWSNTPSTILWNKFVDMLEGLYNSISTKQEYKTFQWMMHYIAASIVEWKTLKVNPTKALKQAQEKFWVLWRWDEFVQDVWNWYEYRTSSKKFFRYKQEQRAKADYWFQEKLCQELATLDRDFTTFDIANVYSTTVVKDLLADPNVSAEQLWSLMSTKWMTAENQRAILKDASEKDTLKFEKAVWFAEQKQRLVANAMLKFWKNWTIDLKEQIDWQTFADVIANVWIRVTNDWAIEWAWADMIKFLNSSDKAAYEDLFRWHIKAIEWDYDEKVIIDVMEKLRAAWVEWEDFSDMWVKFSNMVQDSIVKAAENGDINKAQAEYLWQDVVSRLFVGSFYYIANLHYTDIEDASRLIDDLAFWLVLKNKKQAYWEYYNTLYDTIIKEYKKNWTINENHSRWLSAPATAQYADAAKNVELSSFRWRWYEQEVFNRLTARAEEYILSGLKRMWEEWKKINIGKKEWTSFINKIFTRQSQSKTLISGIVATRWLDEEVLWISNKLDYAHSTEDVADIYIAALKKDNPEVTNIITDNQKDELIKELEAIKDRWFSDQDYETLYKTLESRYLDNALDNISLDEYFRWVLTADEIEQLNKAWETYSNSALNSIPTTWTDDLKKEFNEIWDFLNKPDTKNTIDNIVSDINDWNNYVKAWEQWDFATIMADALKDGNALQSFFNVKDKKWIYSLTTELTKSSNKAIRKVVIDFSSKVYEAQWKWLVKWLSLFAWVNANPTSIAARNPEVWRLLTKWIDFVNNKPVFIADWWAIKEFFDIMWIDTKWKRYTIKTVVNEIINAFVDEFKNWADFDKISIDIRNLYTNRFRVNNEWNAISSPQIKKRLSEYKYQVAWDKYKAAIDAYIEILSKRHSDLWWLEPAELDTIFKWIEEIPWWLSFTWGKKAKDATKLLWLNWYWLWLSYHDISKLKKTAAVYHPALFNNYLYSTFSKTKKVFNAGDFAIQAYRTTEEWATNFMYGLFYNVIWAWLPNASQQVATNLIEVTAKTLWELADINIDPDVYEEILRMVDSLIPSEIIMKWKWASRAELDTAWAATKIWAWIKDFINRTSALAYADKSAENAVIKYSLTSALMNMWYNWAATKELLTRVIQKRISVGKLDVNNVLDLDKLITMDSRQASRWLDKRIKSLQEAWNISVSDWVALKKWAMEFSETCEPLREAAKTANYQKNTFYQISQVPELTQNLLVWRAWPANMRFFNWATRKAWEYAYNMADAIRRQDWSLLAQYAASAIYRWALATKIYVQMNKATSDTGGVDYREFFKMMFLPYTVLNMAIGSLPDIMQDTFKDISEGKNFLNAITDAVFWVWDNLKWRLSMSLLYWIWQNVSVYKWANMLAEKETAANYFAWKNWVPVVNQIREVFSKVFTNRINRFSTLKSGWIFKNDNMLADSDVFINLMLWWYVTNNMVNARNLMTEVNNAIYKDMDNWTSFRESLISSSRDWRYAYMAYNQYLYDKWLDEYLTPWTWLWELQYDFDKLYSEAKFLRTLWSLWFDVETYKEMLQDDFAIEWSDSNIKSYKELEEKWYEPYWAKAILNMAIMSNASMSWLLSAWEWTTPEQKREFEERLDKLYKDILEERDLKELTDPKALKVTSYNDELIQKMIAKYWNQFWEEIVMATTIKAIWTTWKTKTRNALKKWLSTIEYWKNKYWEWWIDDIVANGSETLGIIWYKQLMNDLVTTYYPALQQWNQFLANNMMHSHAALKEDYPLNSEMNMKSSMWAAVDVLWMRKNVMYQWLPAIWMDWVIPEFALKVLNATNLTPEQKFEFLDKELEIAATYDKFTEDTFKAGMSYPILKYFDKLYNANPEWFEKNWDWIWEKLKLYTVSRPLSDEDIKQEVRESIFKTTKSWSWSKWRKWSISFNKPAQDLTKFQAFKRQFEQNVMWQEPLNKIAYKATSNWITPIQLSVWEAKAIDEKYSFIKPQSFETPKSEKTPDIVVKQVKTTSSKYSGKAIKQSNIYKVKKVL